MLSLKANPHLFNRGTVGSYEYIRMGERLIDKNNYEGAVNCFEKAYESSPDSDAIKANLVWIYTVYGSDLAKSGQLSRSLYFLTRAYDLKRNAATVQNLAVAYARKGVDDIRRGNSAQAIARFEEARETASLSDRASSDLGIFLYNEAAKMMNELKGEAATLVLNESALANESKYPLMLLGDIYYRRADLEEAAFYWKRALAIDPENKELAEKIDRAAREIEAERSQESAESGHFELRYDRKLRFDVAGVQDALEKAYYNVGRKLNYFPKGRTLAFLYSEDDFRNIFKLSPVVRAFYDGNIRMPLPKGSPAKDELIQFINHEYTHAVISAMTENKCPVWLSEGIAVSMQIKPDDPRIRESLSRFGDLSGLALDPIYRAFRDADKDPAESGPYYLPAYTVVQYITDTFGGKALRGILGRIRGGQHFANAMDDELLMSEKEFEKRWKAWTIKKYGLTEKGGGNG